MSMRKRIAQRIAEKDQDAQTKADAKVKSSAAAAQRRYDDNREATLAWLSPNIIEELIAHHIKSGKDTGQKAYFRIKSEAASLVRVKREGSFGALVEQTGVTHTVKGMRPLNAIEANGVLDDSAVVEKIAALAREDVDVQFQNDDSHMPLLVIDYSKIMSATPPAAVSLIASS